MDPLEARWAACFDYEAPVLFFPVRHHSPACAIHLQQALAAYRPDCILIEGPSDTNHLIAHLGAPENKAPLCIYYASVHKEPNDAGEEVEHRAACYYPMLDFSPELCAIRWGVRESIPTRFIDLPYAALSRMERGGEDEDGKGSYYDDYYLSRSRFIARLCEKQACRSYAELWEKLFELEGLLMDTPRFVRSMLALCHYSRVEYPPELLEEEGCLAREEKMAAEIQLARREYERILVVTGGFHTAALFDLMNTEVTPRSLPQGKAEAYLIPYSFSESDQLAGYASGMPYPAFYQRAFEGLSTRPDTAYDDAALDFLARIGGMLRRRKESTSLADEVAASMQSQGLAELRGKPQQGVFELLDGVRSAYVKGAISASSSLILSTATELLRGDRIGEVISGADVVPLLVDFRETAKRLRLKTDRTTRQEVVLEILAKPTHRETSAFFHRLDYLDITFAEQMTGPRYRDRDTTLVREKWSYAAGARAEASVIAASYLGGTLREAASTALSRDKSAHTGCGEVSQLLIDAAVMDLTEHVAPLLSAMEDAVTEDGSFASLALAVRNLLFLESAEWLLSLPDLSFVNALLGRVYLKAATLVPALDTADEGEDRELAKTLKDLHQIARRDSMDAALLEEGLRELTLRESPPPTLQGSAAGLLYAADAMTASEVLVLARSYLFGTGEQQKKSGRFLGGIFLCAWDILFEDTGFLSGLSAVLRTLSHEDFLQLLPDLRLAFSAFTPSQIDRVSEVVAELLGIREEEVTRPGVPEALLALGRSLDDYAASVMKGGSHP